MEKNSIHSLSTGNHITKFHIPENGVIINGLPEKKEEPILTEVEILNSKIEMLEFEIQKAREEAYNEGFNASKQVMDEENSEKLKTEIGFFIELKNNLENEIKETISKISHPIVELSKEMTQKIIERELDSSQKWIELIKSKIEKYCHKELENTTLNIKVNEQCIDILQSEEISFEKEIITFSIDNNLKPGECTIESDNHIIDASFQNQVQNIINDIL
ncbi:MAG: hypothetical protein CMF96_01120 [Candidatus Marinimicrobia bacterium]|nr:hypothetical protein [Candidatus Neomarinimicrobiota bacterium]|tara:strand:- start:5983 stop:6636 length:654 start_codon:yes stop_codon:yes gene_type:complete